MISRNLTLKQVPEQTRQSIYSIAKQLQVVLDDRPTKKSFPWDGKTFATKTSISNLIHEFCHFLVCSPDRRRLADFGLKNSEQLEPEEYMASLLGILIERELGINWILTTIEHNWLYKWWPVFEDNEICFDTLQDEIAIQAFHGLLNLGLVDENLKVVFTRVKTNVPEAIAYQVSRRFIDAILAVADNFAKMMG